MHPGKDNPITQKRDSHDRETGRTVTLSGRTIETTAISYYSYDGAYGINLYSTFLPNSVSYTRGGGTKTLAYTYDSMNNIATITDGTETITYTYDSQNRLIREDNEKLWQSYVYTYDAEGNITSKKTGVYMAADTNMSTSSYVYADGKLMRYGTQRFLYDAAGNPTVYRSKTATWVGRKLTSYNGTTFGYDGKGRRISKDDIEYTYDSKDRLIASSDGMQYYYDHTGVSGFRYNNATYVYEKDIQGNIIAILDSIGRVVVEYTYDAWGNHTVTTYGGNSTLGAINPFRYRGYFYDTETGFYYLQTRYYDPVIGRFLNMDSIDYADPETINGLNLYAYCNNNPVMNVDPDGHIWHVVVAGLIGLVAGVVGQVISDCLTGEWSSWQTYAGAAVGGFVAGALSTVASPVVASAVGSLVSDATTLGLNLLTGQEQRTPLEIFANVVENAALSAVFAGGGSLIGNMFSGNTGAQLLRPLVKETGKVTAGVFFKELSSELVSSAVESVFDYAVYLFGEVF